MRYLSRMTTYTKEGRAEIIKRKEEGKISKREF